MKWTEPTDYGIDWNPAGQGVHPGNAMPVPWKELTLEEFLAKAFCNPWQLTGEGYYRSVRNMPTNGEKVGEVSYGTTFLHHQNGYTLAVMKRYERVPKDTVPEGWAMKVHAGEASFGKDRDTHHYAHVLRFFWVGCQHKNMKEVGHKFAREELGISTWGMFCHVRWCPDCGYHFTVDSSG